MNIGVLGPRFIVTYINPSSGPIPMP
jgi:hypothetical protein